MNSMQTRMDQLLQASLAQLQKEYAKGFDALARQLHDLQSGWEKDVKMLDTQIKSLQDRVARLEQGASEDSDDSEDLEEGGD